MSPVYWALAILGIAGWLLGMAGWVLLGFIAGLHARRQRARDHEDQAIALTKPPARDPRPAPGHHGGPPTRTYAYPCGRLITAYGNGRRTEVPCQCPPHGADWDTATQTELGA